MPRRFFAVFAALACALFFATAAQAQDATLARAKALIDAKKSTEAFALLDPLEDARAGDPDFDYLLGMAAIDSGHLTRGVFALERVIAVKPNFPEARAEIARAYFLMGENRAAREEFEAVKASNPPPSVVTNVNQFLDALQARESVRDVSGITGYLEASYGYDTNANAATSTGNFAIPALSGAVVTLNSTGQKTNAWFYGVGGGLAGRYKLSPEWTVLGSASLTERYVMKFDQFDTGYLSADGGISWKRDRLELLGLLQTQESRVDDNSFRRANGGTAQLRYGLTADSEATLYLQHTRLAYPGQHERDTVRDIIGTGYAKSFAGSLTPTLYAGFYTG
ncbi:MAG TPA: tetratricopeptide repeat protein, partial [Burkholderiales bacterium]